MMSDPFLSTSLFLAGLGALFLVIGLAMLRTQLAFRRRAVRCRGTVVEYRMRWSTGGGTGRSRYYHPVLEFRTADGRAVRTESSVASGRQPHPLGAEVMVVYDPRDPQRAYPGSGTAALLIALAFAGLGAILCGVGLAVWARYG